MLCASSYGFLKDHLEIWIESFATTLNTMIHWNCKAFGNLRKYICILYINRLSLMVWGTSLTIHRTDQKVSTITIEFRFNFFIHGLRLSLLHECLIELNIFTFPLQSLWRLAPPRADWPRASPVERSERFSFPVHCSEYFFLFFFIFFLTK